MKKKIILTFTITLILSFFSLRVKAEEPMSKSSDEPKFTYTLDLEFDEEYKKLKVDLDIRTQDEEITQIVLYTLSGEGKFYELEHSSDQFSIHDTLSYTQYHDYYLFVKKGNDIHRYDIEKEKYTINYKEKLDKKSHEDIYIEFEYLDTDKMYREFFNRKIEDEILSDIFKSQYVVKDGYVLDKSIADQRLKQEDINTFVSDQEVSSSIVVKPNWIDNDKLTLDIELPYHKDYKIYKLKLDTGETKYFSPYMDYREILKGKEYNITKASIQSKDIYTHKGSLTITAYDYSGNILKEDRITISPRPFSSEFYHMEQNEIYGMLPRIDGKRAIYFYYSLPDIYDGRNESSDGNFSLRMMDKDQLDEIQFFVKSPLNGLKVRSYTGSERITPYTKEMLKLYLDDAKALDRETITNHSLKRLDAVVSHAQKVLKSNPTDEEIYIENAVISSTLARLVRKEKESDLFNYKILSIKNSPWNESMDEGVIFELNGEMSKFENLIVNGKTLTFNKDYFVEPGSVFVTLNLEYLKTLELDTHNIEFLFQDGFVNGTFITEALLDNEDQEQDNQVPDDKDNEVPEDKEKDNDHESPLPEEKEDDIKENDDTPQTNVNVEDNDNTNDNNVDIETKDELNENSNSEDKLPNTGSYSIYYGMAFLGILISAYLYYLANRSGL